MSSVPKNSGSNFTSAGPDKVGCAYGQARRSTESVKRAASASFAPLKTSCGRRAAETVGNFEGR